MWSIVVTIDAYDPVADALRTLYISNNAYVSGTADTPSDTQFTGCIENFEFTHNLTLEPGYGGGAELSIGSIVMSTTAGKVSTSAGLLDIRDVYGWDFTNRECVIYARQLDGTNATLTQYLQIVTGTIESWEADRNSITFNPTSREVELDRPLKRDFYKGSGFALRGNSSTDVVTVTDDAALDQQTTFTLEAIARRNGTGANSEYIVYKRQMYGLFTDSSGNIVANLNDSGGTQHILTSTTVLSELAHITVRWESTLANSTIYVNGVDTGATYSTTSQAQVLTFDLKFLQFNSTNWFNGDIAQVRLWSDIRTDEEVEDFLWDQLKGDEAGLVGYWPFDEGTGTTIGDDTSSANNGTASGTTWVHSLEGDDDDLRGKAKPITLGKVLNRKLILVDPGNLVYQFHDGGVNGGSIDAIRANFEEITFGSDSTDIYGTTPSAAQYTSDKSRGLIRLGTNYGDNVVITGDFTVGTDLSPSDVLKELVVNWTPGWGALDIETGGFTALDSSFVGLAAGIAIGHEEPTTLELMDGFVVPLSAYWTLTTSGQVTVARFPIPEDETADETFDQSVVSVPDMEMVEFIRPVGESKLGYEKYWYVHSVGEIGGGVTVTKDIERAQEEFLFISRVFEAVKANYIEPSLYITAGYAYWDGTTGTRDRVFGNESRKVRDLWGVPRRVFRVPIAKDITPVQVLDLGEIAALDFTGMDDPAFGLDAVKNFVVVGVNQTAEQVTYTLWG
jgi:hypothetical protein